MKANLLLVLGLVVLVAGLGLFSVALGVTVAGMAMVGLSFAFTEPEVRPEDRHLPVVPPEDRDR